MDNRWMNALVKTIIIVIVLHAIFLAYGFYSGNRIGWFGWPMIWPHWHDGISIATAVIAGIILYFLIYFIWPGRSKKVHDG